MMRCNISEVNLSNRQYQTITLGAGEGALGPGGLIGKENPYIIKGGCRG
jgi:hypothetical protein